MSVRARALLVLGSVCLCVLATPSPIVSAGPGAGGPAGRTPGWEAVLAPPGEPGEPLEISGRVVEWPDARPLRDMRVYAYNADAVGHYGTNGRGRPRVSGTLHTNVLGEYRIRTILPGRYGGGEPHVHFEIFGPHGRSWAVALTLFRQRGAGSDTGFALLSPMIHLPETGYSAYVDRGVDGVMRAQWDIPLTPLTRIRAPGDTARADP
jgi:hypothetical protein